MPDIIVRKVATGFVVADRQGQDVLAKLKDGDLMTVTVKRPRNVKHHNKLWKLLEIVCENQELYETPEALLVAIKMELGYVDIVVDMSTGERLRHPRSISFSAMDELEFSEFYDKAVNLIVSRVLPGIGREALEHEVLEMIAGRRAA